MAPGFSSSVRWARRCSPSITATAILAVISLTERSASSLPGMGQALERAVARRGLDLAQFFDALADRVEVREHAAQPSLRDVEHLATLGFFFDDRAGLSLGADEEDGVALGDGLPDEIVGGLEPREGLLQVDNVNAVALSED